MVLEVLVTLINLSFFQTDRQAEGFEEVLREPESICRWVAQIRAQRYARRIISLCPPLFFS